MKCSLSVAGLTCEAAHAPSLGSAKRLSELRTARKAALSFPRPPTRAIISQDAAVGRGTEMIEGQQFEYLYKYDTPAAQ